MKIVKLENNIESITDEVSQILLRGGIVAMAFDTVYGFVVDATNEEAIDRLNALKGRPETKTLGVAVANVDDAGTIAQISESQFHFIENMVPGRYSFVLRDNPANIICEQCKRGDTILIRIPDSELVLRLADKFGPLGQTSANKTGGLNCYSISEMLAQFSQKEQIEIDLIVNSGILPILPPSEIWDLTGTEPKKIERK